MTSRIPLPARRGAAASVGPGADVVTSVPDVSSAMMQSAVQNMEMARSIAEVPCPSALDLGIATEHLRRLKDRVRKSMASLPVLVWKRTLRPHSQTTKSMYAQAGRNADLELEPEYSYSKTLRCASEAIRLEWNITAAEICHVFHYWNHQSAFLYDDGQARACVNEIRKTSLDVLRAAIGHRITLIVWRLQYIIEDHTCPRVHGRPGYRHWEDIEDGPFDDQGFTVPEPLILTASDVLPLTQHEAVTLAHMPQCVQALHKGVLQERLCYYGDEMLRAYRARAEQQKVKGNKKNTKSNPLVDTTNAEKPVDDLVMVTECEDDRYEPLDDAAELEEAEPSSDPLMRH